MLSHLARQKYRFILTQFKCGVKVLVTRCVRQLVSHCIHSQETETNISAQIIYFDSVQNPGPWNGATHI